MQTKIETSEHLTNVGTGYGVYSGGYSSTLERWRQKLGYCTIFAVVPAILASTPLERGSTQAKESKAALPALDTAQVNNLNLTSGNRALLKQQTEFRLRQQQGAANKSSLLSELDNCPGHSIPGNSYTAASPYLNSSDTTGANNTVNNVLFDYAAWSSEWPVPGPDHIYSFRLIERGANPQIQLSTPSNSFKPVIYILDSQNGCPSTNASTTDLWSFGLFESIAGTIKINTEVMNLLPLNVPLYLLVDSLDARGSGSYTLKMQDVTIAPLACASANQIDCADFMVRQHYRDFLNREPDSSGLTFWINDITSCGVDAECAAVKRINVSAAFFLSLEFQGTGYLVYKSYTVAYGSRRIGSTVPLSLSEFAPDVQRVGHNVVVGKAGWQAQLEANQSAYFNEFVQSAAFLASYPPTMPNGNFVDLLNANAGNVLSTTDRDALVRDLSSGAKTRAQVLRAVVDNELLSRNEFNRAFVLMQYFGYLRRNPNDSPDHDFGGYNFWLAKLNEFSGNFVEAEMVKAFISSTEYRGRFGKP